MVKADNFEYRFDGAGNQSAIFRCGLPNAKTLLIGSHLDSVKNGGRFDGVLGVLAAYEVLLTLRDLKDRLPFDLEVINFTDEEGSILGLMGSSALSGVLSRDRLMNPRGGREALLAGMNRIGIHDESVLNAKRDPSTLLGYVELHIEQGTRLERANRKIGVVSAIVGLTSYRLRFIGEAGHAGTTAMEGRKDAFQGAAVYSERARRLVIDRYAPGVVNFGILSVSPGMFNIIPGEVLLGMEFRHGVPAQFALMERELLELASEVAQCYGLGLEYQIVEKASPALMSERFMKATERAAEALDLSHTRLMSFAGHDAQTLSQCTEAVMVFIPSRDGISHNPREYSTDEDCVNGANVILHTVLELAALERGV
jgi:hydantoinase/carbamoylase family amidase